MSIARMSRYLVACNGNTKKAMTLYRNNLKLSQEMFTIISCLEIAVRNAVDRHCLNNLGNDWLQNGTHTGGIFDNRNCRLTTQNINEAINKLGSYYSHQKLVAELGFGFWRYMFAPHQYTATGRTLLHIFPSRPRSSPTIQYNHTYIFNQLAAINEIRNRIAHHEPICFTVRQSVINTMYVRQHYVIIIQLFQWLNIDQTALLYGLDHINTICNQIDAM